LIDARLSAPVLGADTGATATTLRVAAARPAARKERTDTVIEDFSLFITFAVGLCL
jgi:3-hydroxyisobutyrate dehydrogenase-like beta-hydroxyacid dehydrogenase